MCSVFFASGAIRKLNFHVYILKKNAKGDLRAVYAVAAALHATEGNMAAKYARSCGLHLVL